MCSWLAVAGRWRLCARSSAPSCCSRYAPCRLLPACGASARNNVAYFDRLAPVAALRSLSFFPATLSLALRRSFLVIADRYSVRESLPSPFLSALLKFLARNGFFAASILDR